MIASSPEMLLKCLPATEQEGLAISLIHELCFWEMPSPCPETNKRLLYLEQQIRLLEEEAFSNERRSRSHQRRRKSKEEVSLSEGSKDPAAAWKATEDPRTGRTYYYNKVTRKTQWEKPLELKMFERQQRREFRKKQKAFFAEMESNIQRSLSRGELIPCVPIEKTEKIGPPLEPLAPPPRVRTISGMNEQLLAELRDDHDDSNRNETTNKGTVPPMEGRPPLPLRRTSTNTTPNTTKQPAEQTLLPPKPPLPSREPLARLSSDLESLQGEHLLDEPLMNEDMTLEGKNVVKSSTKSSGIARPAPLTVHKRRNTGGTIFVQSTMEKPNIKATIKCVCGVFRAHIVQSQRVPPPGRLAKIDLKVFQDHRQQKNRSSSVVVPSLQEIESFYEKFYERSQMEQDTIIMSLIYVERLIKETDGALTPTPETWASILFSCMILASKVWDDLSMWNVDFSNVSLSAGMSPFSLKRINRLEFAVLTCLNYNVKVPASEYAKYYFLIRTMLTRSGLLEHASSPLNKEQAQKLEFRTAQYQDANFHHRPDRDRARSFDMNCLGSAKVQVPEMMKDRACLEQLVSMDTTR